jgi:hypothetical protein
MNETANWWVAGIGGFVLLVLLVGSAVITYRAERAMRQRAKRHPKP